MIHTQLSPTIICGTIFYVENKRQKQLKHTRIQYSPHFQWSEQKAYYRIELAPPYHEPFS